MKTLVLDHGYVEFVEAWGTGKTGEAVHDPCGGEQSAADFEVGIIEAARQSTQASFRGWEGCRCAEHMGFGLGHLDTCPTGDFKQKGDAHLLQYLYNHHHSTPFEFSGMVIEVQAPIFVFREWHRHRTQSYNEMSARYAALPDLYYVPAKEVLLDRADEAATTRNKQASAIASFNKEERDREISKWWWELQSFYNLAEAIYQRGLSIGVPKELARLVVPVGHYTKMRASANLRNWLAFLTLRLDPAAQWEIRQFADAVAKIVAAKFPRTYQLWAEAQPQP